MVRYIGKRLLQIIPIFFVVSVLIFALVRMSPTEPITVAIIITVVTFNVLSDNIQMYLDPTQRKLPPFKKLKKMAGGLVEE